MCLPGSLAALRREAQAEEDKRRTSVAKFNNDGRDARRKANRESRHEGVGFLQRTIVDLEVTILQRLQNGDAPGSDARSAGLAIELLI